MAIGVIDKKLNGAVRSFFGGGDERDSQFGNSLSGDVAVVDHKCEMVPA